MKPGPVTLLCVLCVFVICCAPKNEEGDTEVVIVRIPPRPDPTLTAGENHCVFYAWWHEPEFRRDEVLRGCAGAALPHDGVPLIVELDEGGSLRINSEPAGTLSETNKLAARLREVFEMREENAVYADGTNEIEKSVALLVPRSAKHKDAVGLAVDVKHAGADPIMLVIDGLLPSQAITPASAYELAVPRDKSDSP